MKDPHYDYTKDEIIKNLILLESHGKNYPCKECIKKHLITVEGLAEEGELMTDDLKEKNFFRDLHNLMRGLRLSMLEKVE